MNLSAAELALTRADRDLLALPRVLDAEAMLKQLGDGYGTPFADKAAKRYIRYKPGTNCLVAYELKREGRATSVYAKAFSGDFDIKHYKAVQIVNDAAGMPKQLWIFPNEKLLVRRFPNDGKLSSLQRLTDGDSRRHFLQGLIPLRPEFWDSPCVELAYKPERRYVCRIQCPSGKAAVIKLYGARAFRRSLDNCRFLERSGYMSLPPRIGHSRRHRAIAFDWYPGDTLRELAAHDGCTTVYASQVGSQLADLHQIRPANSLQCWDPAADIKTIEGLARTLALLLPNKTDTIELLTRRLSARLRQAEFKASVMHGDFHSKQVLLHNGAVRFLDLDELAIGTPEYDLGTFLAHLRRDVLRAYLEPVAASEFASRFMDSYVQNGSEPRQIGLYTALALLKFSHHPFRACEQHWELGIDKILRAASQLVDCDDMRSALNFAEIIE